MNCPECNQVVKERWKKCPACGTELKKGFFSKLFSAFGSDDESSSSNKKTASLVECDYHEEDGSGAFNIRVDDVFEINGKGVVVTGKVRGDSISKGDNVTFKSADEEIKICTVLDIEQFRKKMNTANVGDNVGLLLSDIKKDDISSGVIISKSGSNTRTLFESESSDEEFVSMEPAVEPVFEVSESSGSIDLMKIKRLVIKGKKIEAIKLFREMTGLGLKEAKKVVDAIEEDSDGDTTLELELEEVEEINEVDGSEIKRILRNGDKIKAIKLYRKMTGLGLKEAKEAVEEMEE